MYDATFWAAYIANLLVCVVMALLYRYADFVAFLGGTEFHLGWIVGVGMVGSVAMRLSLGSGIDRYGPRLVWLGSLGVLAATCFAHLGVRQFDGVAIYVLRILFCTSIAGIFSASTAFVSGRGPAVRMAELIGMLGTSGFAGMMLGTLLGDLIFHAHAGVGMERAPVSVAEVSWLFLAAGMVALAAVPFAWSSTRRLVAPGRREGEGALAIVRRYSPPWVLGITVVVGAALTLPATFLRPFAAELHIPRIGLFFTVCAPIAVAVRLATRRMPERHGLPRIILAGMGLMVFSQLLFLVVRTEWQLALPGAVFGGAQAILYPMLMAGVCHAFPPCYRGMGTALSLAALDLGQVIGSPAAGAIVHYSPWLGLPSYATMFATMAAVLMLTAAAYAGWGRHRDTSCR